MTGTSTVPDIDINNIVISSYPEINLCKQLTKLGFPETKLFWGTWDEYQRPPEITNVKLPQFGFIKVGPTYYVCPELDELLAIFRKNNIKPESSTCTSDTISNILALELIKLASEKKITL